MNAHTLTHQIAAPLEVIPADLGLKAQNLATAIKVLEITDQTTFEAGNKMLLDSHQALKDLEAARTRLKKPITELGREIDRVVASVAEPLDVAKRAMQGKVAKYQQLKFEESAKAHREAEAKAKQEREAAEKERQRLQAEADEKHEREVRAAKAKALEEASELEAVLGKPVEVAPVVVAPAPVIQAAPVATVVPVAPAPAKAATQIVKVPVVVVKDAGALATWLFANGHAALVEFQMREIVNMSKAGVPVPGLETVMREQNRMVGGA